jgi:phosphoribosylglycinamide formyltransferase-1
MTAQKETKRLAVLVSGGGTNLQAVLDGIGAGEIPAQIVAVISSNPRAYALERAREKNIPARVCALKDYADGAARDAAILKILREARADALLSAG